MARPPAFIDHIIIRVADLSRSLEFYRAALEPLGAEVTELPGPPESSWGPAVVLGGLLVALMLVASFLPEAPPASQP